MNPKNNQDDSQKKMRLGEYLLKKGLISQENLSVALQTQEATGQALGQILLKKHFIDEIQLYQVLAEQLNLEFLDISGIEIPKEVVSLVSGHLAKTYSVMPIKKEHDILTVAMMNPTDTFAIDELRVSTGMDIKPVMSSKTQLLAAVEKYYSMGAIGEVLKIAEGNEIQDVHVAEEAADIEKIKQFAEEAPIVKLVNAIIEDGVKNRASDIHIEPLKKECRVRCRIDGVLRDLTFIASQFYRPVISRIKILANMDIAEKRLPQDGSFRFEGEDRHVDIRVSTYPTMYGEKLVMRLLVREEIFLPLDKIGFEPEELSIFETLIKRSCGIVLVVGPTGSGKTTTLYSALAHLNSREKNIITIEDPIEYEIEGIAQSQINPKAGFNFANSLRSMMRQDPDIILIGEIRDLETAELAIRAALTGHLVFSTLHTNDAIGAVTRLTDMGIEPFLISSSLIGVLAQRLIKLICPHCRQETVPSDYVLDKFKEEGGLFKTTDAKFYRGKGCEYCRKTGYRSREGIFELLQISGDEMREGILSHSHVSALKKIARGQGFRSLKENGFKKALRGTTTLEEILEVTELI